MANNYRQPTQSDLDREKFLQGLASAQSKAYAQSQTETAQRAPEPDYTTAPDRVSLYDLSQMNQSAATGAPKSDSPVLDFWKRQQAARNGWDADYAAAPDRVSLYDLSRINRPAATGTPKPDAPAPDAQKTGLVGLDTDYTYAPDRVPFTLVNFLVSPAAEKAKTPNQPAAEQSAPWQNTPQYGDDGTPLAGALAQTGKPGYDGKGVKTGGLIDEAALEAAIADAFPEYSPDDDEDDWLEKPLQPDDEDDWLESGEAVKPPATQSDTEKYVYDPMNWESELYGNVAARVAKLSPELNEEDRSESIDAIMLEEAEKLQQKYGLVYRSSDNWFAYFLSPGVHSTLAPLFTEYPTKETETNSLAQAAFNGFSDGFSMGLWSEASKGIYPKGTGETTTGAAGKNFSTGSYDDLPSNAQNSYNGYEENGWKGNYSGQTPGTNAGRAWGNEFSDLPTFDQSGNHITYREFDVNNRISGIARDSQRFLLGSDGSIYYTPDHYGTFIKIQ